jgi:ADP-ribosylglycohydrolase
VDACRYFGGLIVAALDGLPKDRLLANDYEPAVAAWQKEPLDEKIAAIAAGSFRTKEPPAIRGSGYVVHCLEAALWAFHKTDTFRDGALLAVNLGEDADTTGAVYGQIAGAYYGEEDIPRPWRAVLAMRAKIEEAADRLYEMAEARGASG